MDNSRMSTADMLQYCDEALAWEEFGPVDIFFFESGSIKFYMNITTFFIDITS